MHPNYRWQFYCGWQGLDVGTITLVEAVWDETKVLLEPFGIELIPMVLDESRRCVTCSGMLRMGDKKWYAGYHFDIKVLVSMKGSVEQVAAEKAEIVASSILSDFFVASAKEAARIRSDHVARAVRAMEQAALRALQQERLGESLDSRETV